MKNSVLLALMVATPAAMCAQDAETVDALKKELRDLRQRTEQLEEKLKRFETAPPAAATVSTNVATPIPKDAASTNNAPTSWSPTAPMTLFRSGNSYLDVSLDGLFAVGGSTASDDEIESLQPGGHDPIQHG